MTDDPRRSPRLTLCAISGNCERYIRRWLDHFQPLADEVVVVRAIGDQQPDLTLAAAKDRGCITGEYLNAAHPEWPHVDDFAAARNLALDLATGDWVMWADMDDVLPEGGAEAIEKFLDHVASTQPGTDAICLPYLVPEDGLETVRERIWRRGRARWQGRVHENLKFEAEQPKLVTMDVADPMREVARIIHAPTGGRVANDERNLRILESIPEIARTIGDRFHFFQSLRAVGRVDDAVQVAIALVQDERTEPPEKAEMFFSLAQLTDSLDHRHAFFLQALAVDPRRREAFFELAQTCINAGKFTDALAWTTAGMAQPRPPEYLWTARDKYYRYAGVHIHSLALRANGRAAEAEVRENNWFTEHDGDISLVHATRGRAAQAWLTRRDWFDRADEPDRIEHVFGIDRDDEGSAALALARSVVVAGDGGPVAAWNAAARVARGQILIQVSDDWVVPRGWDTMIREALAETVAAGRPAVLRISDGGRQDNLLCMAIMTRRRFEDQGRRMFHPGFFSMYSDDWFTHEAERDGVVVDRRDIVFEHRHPAFGKAKMDATYERTNGADKYADGKALLDWLVAHDRLDTYAQNGQDVIAAEWFAEHGERSRRYVDLGAYDGITYSNTKLFDDMGWEGVCVEPLAASHWLLAANRPRARCLRAAASDHAGEAVLRWCTRQGAGFHGRALATLGGVPERWEHEQWAEETVALAPTRALVPAAWTEIDLLSVDCEGHEMEALRGWDWQRCKPRLIICEKVYRRDETLSFLESQGYRIFNETIQDMFLCRDETSPA